MLELTPPLGLVVFVGVLSVAGVTVMAAPAGRPHLPERYPWDLARIGQVYTTVVGSFAGFAAASTVFVARLGADRPVDGFESTMGLFVLSFMMLSVSAMQFGNTPNAPLDGEGFSRIQRISFLYANVTLTQGICTTFLAIRALAIFIDLPALGEAMRVMMVLIVGLGLLRLAQYLDDLSVASGRTCLVMPLIAIAVTVLYFGVLPMIDQRLLLPDGTPFSFAFAGTLLAGTGFAMQSIMFSIHARHGFEGRVASLLERLAVGHTAVAATGIAMLAGALA